MRKKNYLLEKDLLSSDIDLNVILLQLKQTLANKLYKNGVITHDTRKSILLSSNKKEQKKPRKS